MHTRLFITLILGAFVVSAVYLESPSKFGVCYPYSVPSGQICLAPHAQIASWLMPLALSSFGVSLLALIAKRSPYATWLRFTLWYGVIATILMLLAAASEIDIGFLTVSLFDLEKVAQGLAGIYVLSSILLLGISEVLARRKG